jgi:hypothetical protein
MFGPPNDPTARPELTPLEDALRALAPRPPGLDRDAILFRAGQGAAARRWFWPCAAVASTTAAVILGVLLSLRPQTVVERIVYVPAPVPQEEPSVAPTESGPAASSFSDNQRRRQRLQEHLLNWGFDGLTDPGPDPEPPARYRVFHPLSGESLP